MFRAYLLLLVPALVFGQDTARMDQIAQSWSSTHHFMGAVLVARGNDVIFSKAYGSANLEWNIPNSPSTKFRLGSLTKQFTAAAILLLEEQGKLSTGDPVKKYMPDAPAEWDNVTIFHLLTHTSGIPNFTSFPEYPKLEPFAATPGELVGRFRDKPLDFAPGEKWSYSNSGYVLLTWLIEKVSGAKYEDFMQKNIFTPLGMKDSGVDSNTRLVSRRASGYSSAATGFQNAGFIHMSIPQGAGALYSTTEDLLKWEQGLFGGKLLQPASLQKMITPFKQNYAFGVGSVSEGGRRKISHNGGIEGFVTQLDYYPDDKLTVAILANVENTDPAGLATNLAELARGGSVTLPGERKRITLDPKVLARYVGAYRLDPATAIVITLDDGQLFEKLGGQQAFPLFAETETAFFLKAVDAQFEFSADALVLHQNGRSSTAPRLSGEEAKSIVDAAAAIGKRFKDQTPDPRGEAALRKLIEGVRTGRPDYNSMGSGLADAIRTQLPQMQPAAVQMGALQSLTFKGVGTGGADIYKAVFANGSQEYRIALSPDGRIERANVRPL